MTLQNILDDVRKIYIDVIPEDDVKNREKMDKLFSSVKLTKQDGLESLYIACIRANGVLGGKYDALRHYARVREYLEQHFDKTYLGVLSVAEKPAVADRSKILKEIIFPIVTANMKAQGVRTPTINKKIREFRINDWFYDLANFIAMNALVFPIFFAYDKAFTSALTAQIARWYVGMMPEELTFDFFEEVRKAVVEKVINKNLK